MPDKKKKEKKVVGKGKKTCQVNMLDTEGKAVGKINLPEKIFAAEINKKLIAQAVRVYLANQRQGSQKTKSRGEIKASKAKIYRQKGTGRARHGAKSAPIFVGGGVAHGPRLKDFSLKMPKKMRRAALFSALTDKLQKEDIIAVKGLEEVKPKTKEMVKILANLKILSKNKRREKLLLILPKKLENLERAARNIENVALVQAALLNTYLTLNHRKILFLKDSFSVLEQTFLSQKLEGQDEKEPRKETKVKRNK